MKRVKWHRAIGVFAVVSFILNVIFAYMLFPSLIPTNKNMATFSVKRVIDGDTFDTQSGERIRLFEIDAPEYPKDCLSIEAKARLETLILNKRVRIETHGKDNFGRMLAVVYIGDLSINEALLEEGMVLFWKSKTPTVTGLAYERLQEKAQLAARGVWSALCKTGKAGCTIKGNYRSADTTRIYHTSDCYNYNRITIKPGTSDRWFCTETEAQKAGFQKSKDCPLR